MSGEGRKTLVTSALIYANGPVHIGHMVEYIQTDIYVRFLKLAGREAYYCGADDTHGTPIEINAAKAGMSPEEFIEYWWHEHKRDYESYLVDFDSYYTTNSPENKYYTELIFNRLKDRGHIYKKEIELTYCENCGRFLPDRYVRGRCPNCGAPDQYGDVCEVCNTTYTPTDLVDPRCSICGSTPVRKSSEHYFFRLSSFAGWLRDWLVGNRRLQPEIRNQVLRWVDEGLEDWCISRDGPYFGFKIPGEENKYFYVWLDAPIGYIASTANLCRDKDFTADDIWQTDDHEVIHFIGKDIIYFHLLFWPAVLHGAGFHVPDNVVVHGFLTVEGEKMSKSRGTLLSAREMLDYLDPEYLRFFYAANLSHSMTDIDLDFDNLVNRVNNELVSNLANLVYRVLSFTYKNFQGETTTLLDKEFLAQLKEKAGEVYEAYEGYEFREAVNRILEVGALGNKYFQEKAPWALVKRDPELAQRVLTDCVELVKYLVVMLKPILPRYAARVEEQLGVEGLTWGDLERPLEHHRLSKPEIVFRKMEAIELGGGGDPTFEVDPRLEKLGLRCRLAVIEGVRIRGSSEELERLKAEKVEEIKALDVEGSPIQRAYREVYRRFKVDAKNSAAQLVEAVRAQGGLPTVNTAVDAYNLVSALRLVSAGLHDLDRVKGGLRLGVTRGNELFTPLGEEEPVRVAPGKFAFMDEEKVLCWLDVRQCEETKVRPDTRRLLLYVQGNKETSSLYLEETVEEMCRLITRHCGGSYRILNACDPSRLDLRVGRVLEAKPHPNGDRLWVLRVDLGGEVRTLCAGLRPWYPEAGELEGGNLVVLANLEPATIRGVESQGMLLAGEDGSQVGVLRPLGEPGERVYVEGVEEYSGDPINIKEFSEFTLEVRGGRAYVQGRPLLTSAGPVEVEKVREGRIR